MENIFYIIDTTTGMFLNKNNKFIKENKDVLKFSSNEEATKHIDSIKELFPFSIARNEIKVTSLRQRAFNLYQPPFTFMCGYIFDANSNMVSDKAGDLEELISRLRGFGRISYLPDHEQLQDTVGELLAKLLTNYWGKDIGWKSVKEHGLPTIPDNYLCVIHYSDTGPTQEICRLDKEGCLRIPLCTEVTHWQPCPKLPE